MIPGFFPLKVRDLRLDLAEKFSFLNGKRTINKREKKRGQR
jgi:hypothetical protein